MQCRVYLGLLVLVSSSMDYGENRELSYFSLALVISFMNINNRIEVLSFWYQSSGYGDW